jgi:exopolysaccharide production protein ExoZ
MLSGLQVVRLGAAMAIVLLHVSAFTPHLSGIDPTVFKKVQNVLGQGVLVFFVLSGFLMARLTENSKPFVFFLHRVIRIYPALIVAEALAVIGNFFILGLRPSFDWYLLTLYPMGPIPAAALKVEWTLVYEMFFYVVTMLLCALPNQTIRKTAVAAWAVVIVAANVDFPGDYAAIAPTVEQIGFSYFNLVFIAGMVVWWTRDQAARIPTFAVLVVGLICLTSYAWGLPWLTSTIITTLGASSVLLAASKDTVTKMFARRSPLVVGGDASYGLYLIHIPVITQFLGATGVSGWTGAACALVIAIATGIAFGTTEWRVYLWFRSGLNKALAPTLPAAPRPSVQSYSLPTPSRAPSASRSPWPA